jgi:hypothetical protein
VSEQFLNGANIVSHFPANAWQNCAEMNMNRASDFIARCAAVKVLLAALRSTLTVLAPRGAGLYRFALQKQLLCFDHGSRIIVRAKSVEVLARHSL